MWMHFILDGLVKKLEELEKTAELYKGNLFFTVAELNSCREYYMLGNSLQLPSM